MQKLHWQKVSLVKVLSMRKVRKARKEQSLLKAAMKTPPRRMKATNSILFKLVE